MTACFTHTGQEAGCPDCTSLANSLFLGMVMEVRKGMLTPEEEARMEAWKAEHSSGGPLDGLVNVVDCDGLVTFSPADLLDVVERWVSGDVNAD